MMNPDLATTIKASTLLAMLLIATLGQAQQQSVPNVVQLESEEEPIRHYSVEMIVFQYVGNAAGTTEIFEPAVPVVADGVPGDAAYTGELPPALSQSDPDSLGAAPLVIDMSATAAGSMDAEREQANGTLTDEALAEIPTAIGAGFVPVDPAEYQLRDTWDRLVNLDAYQPLLHTAWIQPTLEKDETVPLQLRRIGDPPLRLDGTVSLYLSRFLHLVVDLSLEQKSSLRVPAAQERVRYYGDNPASASLRFDPRFVTPSVFYRIEEDRIVRNNELRYFDHPKFGVLAKITRIEEAAAEEIDTTGDLLPGNRIQ